jgi:hypothetical protein
MLEYLDIAWDPEEQIAGSEVREKDFGGQKQHSLK